MTQTSPARKPGVNDPRPQIARPPVVVRERATNTIVEAEARAAGLHPVVARVLAKRRLPPGTTVRQVVEARLSDLDSPFLLRDMQRAAERLARAIVSGEVVGFCSDYDSDGLSANAVLTTACTRDLGMKKDCVISIVGHRLEDGYGITDSLVDRILALPKRPTLILSADCGSGDEERIARLRAERCDTIVSDHHALGVHGAPASAYATVNPNQPGCNYPDKTICGVMVAWLLCCATRKILIDQGHLKPGTPTLASYMDFLALGTVADCVSLGSKNNRAVVRAGLARINAGGREAWNAFRQTLRDPAQPITAETIAFGIAPRLNARTRLDDPRLALRYLLTEDPREAAEIAKILESANEQRKDIERSLLDKALVIASEQYLSGRFSLVVFLQDGHHGVQGIVASRLTEIYGRPAVVLSPRSDTEAVGSARSVDGFNVQSALSDIQQATPGLLRRAGGHKAAGGVTIDRERIAEFSDAFESQVRRQLVDGPPGPVQWTDGELAAAEMTVATLDALAQLEPYGREFEAPSFVASFEVLDVRVLGDGRHARLILRVGSQPIPAIWFRFRREPDDPYPVEPGQTGRFVIGLASRTDRGRRLLELRIAHGEPLNTPRKRSGYI